MDMEIENGRLLWLLDSEQLPNYFPLPREKWDLMRWNNIKYFQAEVPFTRLQPLLTVYVFESTLVTAMQYCKSSCSTKWLRLCCRIFRMINSCLLLPENPRSRTPYMLKMFFRRSGILEEESWLKYGQGMLLSVAYFFFAFLYFSFYSSRNPLPSPWLWETYKMLPLHNVLSLHRYNIYTYISTINIHIYIYIY